MLQLFLIRFDVSASWDTWPKNKIQKKEKKKKKGVLNPVWIVPQVFLATQNNPTPFSI